MVIKELKSESIGDSLVREITRQLVGNKWQLDTTQKIIE